MVVESTVVLKVGTSVGGAVVMVGAVVDDGCVVGFVVVGGPVGATVGICVGMHVGAEVGDIAAKP